MNRCDYAVKYILSGSTAYGLVEMYLCCEEQLFAVIQAYRISNHQASEKIMSGATTAQLSCSSGYMYYGEVLPCGCRFCHVRLLCLLSE